MREGGGGGGGGAGGGAGGREGEREREMSACVHSNARPHASHLDEAHFMHTVAPYAAQNHHVSLTAQEDAR